MVLIEIFKRDDKTWTLEVQDSDGNVVDITGATLFFTVKEHKTDDDSEALIKKEITSHTNPTQGLSSLSLTPSDTENIDAGDYYFDFQMKSSSGLITTFGVGTFRIIQDITARTT